MHNRILPLLLLHRSIFIIFILWIFITFASLDNIPWFSDYYDVWRAEQISILILASTGFLLLPKRILLLHSKIILFTTSIALCYFLAYFLGIQNTTSFLTISLNILLIISITYFAITFTLDFQWYEKTLSLVAFMPIPAVIYFFTGIIIQFFDPTYTDHGHNHFQNIRYFNDALLPALLILWLRPSFLAQPKYNKIITTLSILYLYIFLSDGARAIMLAFALAFTTILIFDYSRKSTIKIPLIYLIYAVLAFYSLDFLSSTINGGTSLDNHELVRSSSSGRLDLYMYSLQSFIDNPTSGFGVANFTLPDNPAFYGQGHPHNIILMWLSEMGILGVILTLLLCFASLKLFLIRKHLSVWGWVGIFMLLANGMLSGALIYPFSQMLTLLLITYVYAQYQQTQSVIQLSDSTYKYTLVAILCSKAMLIFAIPILIITTYWIYPYLINTPLNYQDIILDDTLIYRARGPSTWQANPIMNFPKE
ncbi:O-antigen ligase family protein [Wohlfahrtiimonas larvae]|uniref:O-antigen ligase-related domain-containing protein n=1 Tax=Wohlfahrtiimonas larvae TaxID=1157986 RepID=A0ABP9MV61_9GAMM|nr:O-antigen ligase family protein [Wohlfahrtiimonas larvae]